MSFVIKGADSLYDNRQDDLRINVASGVLTLRDGTSGGAPLSGITHGIPANGVKSIIRRPRNSQAYTLQSLMNEFPRYTRIQSDPNSIGAQLLLPMADAFAELLDESKDFLNAQSLQFYPVYNQGIVYEYDFNEATDLDTNPSVSGKLGDDWLDVPVTTDDGWFWKAPPTRIETTSCEVSGLSLLSSTTIAGSGLNTPITSSVDLPLHNRIWIEISGANNFTYSNGDLYDPTFAYVLIYGKWAHDSLRPNTDKRHERILIYRNGSFRTRQAWRCIDRVEVFGLPSGTNININAFRFNAGYRADPYIKWQEPIRDSPLDQAFWRLGTASTDFNSLTQNTGDVRVNATSSDACAIAACRINTDTITDEDIEFNVIDVLHPQDAAGNALSGIIDLSPVPNSNYLLLLDNNSNCWVVDTFKPQPNFVGKTEVTQSPVRIHSDWPANNQETLGSYTAQLSLDVTNTSVGIQRWRWVAHYNSSKFNVTDDGNFLPFHFASGWKTTTDGPHHDTIDVKISGGEYVFELEGVDDNAQAFRTFHAIYPPQKPATTNLPIRGLSEAPSGIDFDYHGRLWVKMGDDTAVRTVLRSDIGIWDANDKVFLTREPYDEVRK